MNQKKALEVLKSGRNVFITGSAGTGKTFLLNQYIDYLKTTKKVIGVTASTGIAATQLNGRTIHSWSGIRIENQFNKEVEKALRDRKLKSRLEKTEVLIIDEISMFDARRFSLVDEVLKTARKSSAPFGGLQIVLCGDFFQLPPIRDRVMEENQFDSLFSDEAKETNFAYHSSAWRNGDLQVCYLDEQYRQKDDEFMDILNLIRKNEAEGDVLKKLRNRINKEVKFASRPTRLYTHNADVDRINSQELDNLPGKEVSYSMEAKGNKDLIKYLKKSCLAPEKLTVKKKAIVMFVKNNFDKGYVNGTLGEVVDFDEKGWPIVKIKSGREIIASPESWAVEENGKDIAVVLQVPLRLAWALTIHKSQGMSLDAAEIDLSRSFELGMGYVALSRVRTLNGIKLIGINELALKVNEDVVEKDKEFRELSESAKKKN